MAQLSTQQREAWRSVLDLVGLPHWSATESVRLGGSEGCFSSKAGRKSLATPHRVTLDNIDQARALINGGATRTSGSNEETTGHVNAPGEKNERQLRRALFAQLLGHAGEHVSEDPADDDVRKRFFPMNLTVYAGEDIEIKKGEVLTIEPDGHDPVLVTYGTVTLEQGGLIRCEAPVLLIVQRFIKKN